MTPEDRLLAIRRAAKKADRERRLREEDPARIGKYAGRYTMKDRWFTLEWDAAEHGYRRRFDPGRWTWEEDIVYSSAQVAERRATRGWEAQGHSTCPR